jgi:C4-dicarboxylate transporter
MKKLERPELEALVSISGNIDFITFTNILKETAHEIAIKNSTIIEEVQFRWNQGRVQEILDILKKIRDAKDELEYTRKQVRKP